MNILCKSCGTETFKFAYHIPWQKQIFYAEPQMEADSWDSAFPRIITVDTNWNGSVPTHRLAQGKRGKANQVAEPSSSRYKESITHYGNYLWEIVYSLKFN